MELKDSTILITGGTSGIGLEFATQFLALGSTVIITGRDSAKLDRIRQQLPNIHAFQSDVSDPVSISRLYRQVTEQFPNLSMLINNAGEMRRLDLLDATMDLENINREIAINLSGPIRMVQQFLPHLRTKAAATILNVTSGLALVPFPLSPIYSASKSGLRAYTQSLRVQLQRTNIRVFELVAPGAKTPLNDKFAGDIASNTLMAPAKLVRLAIKGLQNNRLEIYPGIAGIMRWMSRIAPRFMFNQLSKPAHQALAATTH